MIKKISIILINIFLVLLALFVLDQVCIHLEVKARCDRQYKNKLLITDAYKPIVPLSVRYKYFLDGEKNYLATAPDKKFYAFSVGKKDFDAIPDKEFFSSAPDKKYYAFNPTLNGDEDKGGILILGCSFAYGVGSDSNHNFGYQLNKLTGRTVYNRSMPGWGMQEPIVLFQSGLNKEISNIDYVILLFIDDHIRRLYLLSDPVYLPNYTFFKYKKNHLVLKNQWDLFYLHSYFIRKMLDNAYKKGLFKNEQKDNKFLLDHFLEMNSEIKKYYPNAKFIILSYSGDDIIKHIQEELNNNNIETYYAKELVDVDLNELQYRVSEKNPHPTNKAWDVLVPEFIKKLN